MISQRANVLFIGVVIRHFTLLMTDEQAAMFCPNKYLPSGCILWLNLLIPTGAGEREEGRATGNIKTKRARNFSNQVPTTRYHLYGINSIAVNRPP